VGRRYIRPGEQTRRSHGRGPGALDARLVYDFGSEPFLVAPASAPPVVNDLAALQTAFGRFGAIPDAQMARLLQCARSRSLTKGEWLLHQGESADWLGLLVSGVVRYCCASTTAK
jgi:hypothetical protein